MAETLTPLPVSSASDTPSRVRLTHIFLILAAGILVRIPFYLASRPIWSGDSEGYASFYALWVHHHFFLGERTPVYPLFLGFAQWITASTPARTIGAHAAYAVILMQSTLDVLSAALFYLSLGTLRIRPRTALVAALFLATIPALCRYEMNILNMSFSFAWMVLLTSLFLFIIHRIHSGQPIVALSIVTGITASLAILNRPEFLIFLILLLAFTLLSALLAASPAAPTGAPPSPRSVRLRWESAHSPALTTFAILTALSTAPAILLWMSIMYAGIGQFRMTTLDGWNRTRTVYNLFDRVPPEDQLIGLIMANTYRQQHQTGGVNLREIVWPAEHDLFLSANLSRYPLPDAATTPTPFQQSLQRTLGLVPLPCRVKVVDYCEELMHIKIDVGDYLGLVSTKLARQNRAAWLSNIASNFVHESFNFNYFGAKPSRLDDPPIAPGGGPVILNPTADRLLTRLSTLHAPLLLATYLVTLLCALLSPFIFRAGPHQHWLQDATIATLALASIGTIVGTTVLAGFNRVYSLPHLAVFTICTAYAYENRARILATLAPRQH